MADKQRHEQLVAEKDPMPGNLSLSDTQEDSIQEMDYLPQKPLDNTTGLPSGQQENENEQNKNRQIPDVNIELTIHVHHLPHFKKQQQIMINSHGS